MFVLAEMEVWQIAVRGVSYVSCVPASCFRIWFVSCNYEFIRSRCV